MGRAKPAAEAEELRSRVKELEAKCEALENSVAQARAHAETLADASAASTAAGLAAVEQWRAVEAEATSLKASQVHEEMQHVQRALEEATRRGDRLAASEARLLRELNKRDKMTEVSSAKARIADEQAAGLRRRFHQIGVQLTEEHALRLREARHRKELEVRAATIDHAVATAEMRAARAETALQLRSDLDCDRKAALDRVDGLAAGLAAHAQARAAQSASCAADLAATVERIGAVLAAAGQIRDAELAYANAATLRSSVSGAPHAEHANGLRQLAAHCRDDARVALDYLERSCTEFSSSLVAHETPYGCGEGVPR